MIDKLREATVTKFRKLCQKMKINNWQKEVFMANTIEIMDKHQTAIEKLEKKVKDLESDLEMAKQKKK